MMIVILIDTAETTLSSTTITTFTFNHHIQGRPAARDFESYVTVVSDKDGNHVWCLGDQHLDEDKFRTLHPQRYRTIMAHWGATV